MRVRDEGLRQAESTLRHYRLWLILALLLVAGLSTVAATPGGREQLALSFTREPAPYVALAFPPVPTVQSGGKLTVTFTITGHDGAGATLPYQVDASDKEGRSVASASGTTVVASGRPVQESVVLSLPPGTSWGRLDVRLVGRTEAIRLRNPTGGSSP